MLKAFKQYDVRGLYPQEINEALAAAAASAFQRYTGAGAFAVAHDARASSVFIKSAVVEALIKEGAHVFDLGLAPTPLVGFVMRALKVPAGVMVTASHNPPAYNGLKLQVLTANDMVVQIGKGDGLEVIESVAEKLLAAGRQQAHFRQGKAETYDPRPAYLEALMTPGRGIAGLKVVADHGNGLGAITAEPLFERLKINALHLFAEPDGRFPGHLADPHNIENFKALQQAVVEEDADVGLFFDGDADRVFAVTETGRIVEADVLLALLAAPELKKHRGSRATVYHDLRASRLVTAALAAAGAQAVALPVGNPLFKKKLAEEGGLLAGENSGHIMFAEHGGLDDGLFTALKLLKVLTLSGQRLSQLAAPFWRSARLPEWNLPLPGEPELVFARLRRVFPNTRVSRLDGLTLTHPDWWFNVRASNTEPILRLNLEAKAPAILNHLRRRLQVALQ